MRKAEIIEREMQQAKSALLNRERAEILKFGATNDNEYRRAFIGDILKDEIDEFERLHAEREQAMALLNERNIEANEVLAEAQAELMGEKGIKRVSYANQSPVGTTV